MISAMDLLDVAESLASRERGRPRQASLRRAVSTAYYGAFHHLVAEASTLLVGTSRQRSWLAGSMARAFQHRDMKRVARRFRAERPGGPIGRSLAGRPVPPSIRQLAEQFVLLQEARHAADHDHLERFGRAEVVRLVAETREAIEAWTTARRSHAARVFLTALLVGERMRA